VIIEGLLLTVAVTRTAQSLGSMSPNVHLPLSAHSPTVNQLRSFLEEFIRVRGENSRALSVARRGSNMESALAFSTLTHPPFSDLCSSSGDQAKTPSNGN
jgi:hypothetical protein